MALFDCTGCHEFGMRIEEALLHKYHYHHSSEPLVMFSSNISANSPWGYSLEFRPCLAMYRCSGEFTVPWLYLSAASRFGYDHHRGDE